MSKYTWNMIYRDFKRRHSDLCERGMSFTPHQFMSIIIHIPNRGKLIYDGFRDEITWLAQYEDPKRKKAEEREQRAELYLRFLNEMESFQKTNGASQGVIAERSGISRQSINKYLSGAVMPKTSTMKRICEALHIDL